MRRLVTRVLLAALAAPFLVLSSAAPSQAAVRDPTPLYAHYYIWYGVSSWKRAKIDYPSIGRYSSDEASFMRRHVELAKQAGIDGFLVSWKSTPLLDDRLAKLVEVARRAHFKLGIVYQGLDFERRPLPARKVAQDLDLLARRYGRSPVFGGFSKPIVAWSGTWRFSPQEIAHVRKVVGGRLLLLGTEKNVADYEAKASLFDGDLYYWSSVNPDTNPHYGAKLNAMGQAAHSHGSLWFAPAAPGFDARAVGGHSAVDRHDGATLRREMDAAQQSQPDAIGLISWNEFSENTHVEPSERYGRQALKTLADIRGTHLKALDDVDSSAAAVRDAPGPGALVVVLGFVGLLVLTLVLLRRRTSAGIGRAP
jgi:hypothetical protein